MTPSATCTRALFAHHYRVEGQVPAPIAMVWQRLTDAEAFPTWNSTVTSIAGPIVQGQKLSIRVPIAPDRVFSPTVVEFNAPNRMVWQDGFWPMFQGRRTFTLTASGDTTEVVMDERFEGLFLPMIAPSLPDFVPVFDRYMADLIASFAK